ncbi:hypothetical protein SprV_0702344500 [Sparganum proliferum]
MANRLMDMHGFVKPSLSALSISPTFSASPLSKLRSQMANLTQDLAPLRHRAAFLPSRNPSRPSNEQAWYTSTPRPKTPTTCWYHATIGDKARHCTSPCLFISKQSSGVWQVNTKINAVNLSGSVGSYCNFCVCDSLARRYFLVDTGARTSLVPPTPADRSCPKPGLHLQAVNCFPTTKFGSLSICLRRSFSEIFVGLSSRV